MVRHILSAICSLTLLTLFSSACGNQSVEPSQPVLPSSQSPATSLGALPKDGVQPWEKLDAAGHVMPAPRGASALLPGSNFTPGVERFLEGGAVTNLGEASHLAPAGGTLAYATYRIPLGAQQPGAVTVDANLAAQTEYYVALSDYAAGKWEWHGPFSDGQITLPAAHGDYTSSLGNTFIAVAGFDSGSLDVVGVGVTPATAGDSAAPPAPAAPTAVGTEGGVELTWTPVIAADLAGYRIYYSYSPIPAASANGVQSVPYLEDSTRFVLARQSSRLTYVAIAAVDHSGNVSPLSPVVTVRPGGGAIPALSVSTSIVSGERGTAATLTATGADSYDFDLDGDGVFDVTGSASGTATIDTSAPGIIRPRVRGSNAGGTAVALGSVSLIITGNQRPVAYIKSLDGVAAGAAPLPISLTGADSTDFDGTIAEYAWDAQGDGIFESTSATDPQLIASIADPGTYNARLRVTDNDGAWDVDTFTVNAIHATLRMLCSTKVDVGDNGFALGQYDGWETITKVDWDINSDGVADAETGPTETMLFKCDKPGVIVVNAQATLSTGAIAYGTAVVSVRGWDVQTNFTPTAGIEYISGATIAGSPAACWSDATNVLHFIKAWDVSGDSWLDSVEPLGPTSSVYEKSMTTLPNGRAGIAYLDANTAELRYIYALDDEGATWSAPVTLEQFGIIDSPISLAVINGRPAVAYYHDSLQNALYVRANDALGSSWGAPLVIETSPEQSGMRISLAQIAGRPAVAYELFDGTNSLMWFVRGSNAAGSAWDAPVGLYNLTPGMLEPISLAEVNGTPAVAFGADGGGGSFLIAYARAFDAAGTQWPQISQNVGETRGAGYLEFPRLAVIGGVPAITYTDNWQGSQMLARGNDMNGSGWKLEQVGPNVSNMASALVDAGGDVGVFYGDALQNWISFAALRP